MDLSPRMLEDSGNVDAEVRLPLAEDLGVKEATAFVKGGIDANSATEPTGVMFSSGISETNHGHATILVADALVGLLCAMPATYRNRGSRGMNRTT